MFLRKRAASAVRDSASVEATTSIGALISTGSIRFGRMDGALTTATGFTVRPVKPLRQLPTERIKRQQARVSRPSFAALCIFIFNILTIIANLRYKIKHYIIELSQKCDNMNLWKIKGFVNERGVNIVKEWCDAQSSDVWAAFVAHLSYLSGQMPNKWVRHWVGTLSGGKKSRKTGCAGLIELRFDVGNVEYRPIGYYSGKMEFTILFFATERDGDFDPRNACETAKERKALIDANRERAREFRL